MPWVSRTLGMPLLELIYLKQICQSWVDWSFCKKNCSLETVSRMTRIWNFRLHTSEETLLSRASKNSWIDGTILHEQVNLCAFLCVHAIIFCCPETMGRGWSYEKCSASVFIYRDCEGSGQYKSISMYLATKMFQL